MSKPLAIDLFCGLGGWTEGLLAEGYRVVGFDNHRHEYGDDRYPAQLVIQDVLTIHGSQFKNASLIVASPPCQEYSYMAMPWSRAKAIAADYESGKRDRSKLTALFDACFRIQREASEAAGRHIPLVVENVRGAQPWVGKARTHFGSFYLWGDIPALIPIRIKSEAVKREGQDWNRFKETGEVSPDWRTAEEGLKTVGHVNKRDGANHTRHLTNQRESDGIKQPGIAGPRNNGKGDRWFQDGAARHGSKSTARKEAAAQIAKIPFELARWIGRSWKPEGVACGFME